VTVHVALNLAPSQRGHASLIATVSIGHCWAKNDSWPSSTLAAAISFRASSMACVASSSLAVSAGSRGYSSSLRRLLRSPKA
jgi:hypothetical protein